MTAARRRVLVAITVYNGRNFLFRTVESAARIVADTIDVDVLYLDDASPDVEFAADLARAAAAHGHGYYRTPRNLGIVRNVNLGLLRALDAGYDFVIVCNSDVIFPARFAEQLVAVMDADPSIGSATSWSNNVSIYSVPNLDPDRLLADQGLVDAFTADLAAHFGPTAVDIPAGVSFAMIIRTEALRSVGVMDPIFGRGYCEETDWSLRSLAAGWRLTLTPSVFVYHAGRGSTLAAGLVDGSASTVPENERIIDHRYPNFRSDVLAFERSGVMESVTAEGLEAILVGHVRRVGARVTLANAGTAADEVEHVVVRLGADHAAATLEMRHRGFQLERRMPVEELVAFVSTIADHIKGDIVQRDVREPAVVLAAALRAAGHRLEVAGEPAVITGLAPARYPWQV